MLFLSDKISIFSTSDYIFLKEKCDNFISSKTPNRYGKYKNYYNRYLFDLNDDNFKKINEKSISFMKNMLKFDKINLVGSWINMINPETNKDDEFHNDVSDLTLIIYLNDEFKGGELEYINEKNKRIKINPKKNLYVIMDKKLQHRVLPVIEGIRYSLIFFFEREGKKKEITLI